MYWLNITAALVGFPLAAFVLFSYDGEEDSVNAWIEDLWVTADDMAISRSRQLELLVRTSLKTTNRWLSYVYGHRLISWRAYLMSLTLTQASACFAFGLLLWGLVIPFLSSDDGTDTAAQAKAWAVALTLMIALLYSGALLYRGRRIVAMLIILLYFFAIGPLLFGFGLTYWSMVLGSLLVLTPIDLCLIAWIRDVLQSAERQQSLLRTGSRIMASFLIFPALAAANEVILLIPGSEPYYSARVYLALGLWFAPIVPALTSLLFVAVLLLTLILKLVFELTPRFIYSAVKFEVVKKRKLAAVVAVSLLTLAFPSTATFLEKFAKGLGLM